MRLVRFSYCDIGGIIRGKATHASKLGTRITEGIGQTLVTGFESLAPVEGMGPVGEFRLTPDPSTFTILPYAPHTGSMLCDMILTDGTPWEACPRTFLKRMVALLAEQGICFFYSCTPCHEASLFASELPIPAAMRQTMVMPPTMYHQWELSIWLGIKL